MKERRFGTRYKAEKLGQHILKDTSVVDKILHAAQIDKGEAVLEVGPGTGVLTERLLKEGADLYAVEKDKDSVDFLRDKYSSKSWHLFNEDILTFNVTTHIKKPYKVIANIPYYLTGNLLRNFLEREDKPSSMVLMVQKEVAERAIANPPKANILAISIGLYGKADVVSYVSRNAFYPKPKVDSAILRIGNIKRPQGIDEKKFFRLLRTGFSSPRKKLSNNLAALSKDSQEIRNALKDAGFDTSVRAQELGVKDWLFLYNWFYKRGLI